VRISPGKQVPEFRCSRRTTLELILCRMIYEAVGWNRLSRARYRLSVYLQLHLITANEGMSCLNIHFLLLDLEHRVIWKCAAWKNLAFTQYIETFGRVLMFIQSYSSSTSDPHRRETYVSEASSLV
jgi:hypothetical protein